MFNAILEIFLKALTEHNKEKEVTDNRFIRFVEELEELEVEYADALEDAERWGDLDDSTHWRTAKVNKIKRLIEAKKRSMDMLSNK